MKPHLSIIVPAYNSEATLAQCLKAIFNAISLAHDPVEVIVVDDGSNDNTFVIAKQFETRVFAFPENRGRNAARQLGMSQAKGSILVNIDSDIIIPNTGIEVISQHFKKDQSSQIACGMLADPEPCSNLISIYKNSKLSFLYSKLPLKSAFLYGGIFAFRRILLPEIASKALYADDTDLAQRLASKNIFTSLLKDLKVTHLKNYSLQVLIRDDFIMGLDWAGIAARIKAWSRLHKRGKALAHCSRHFISLHHFGKLIRSHGLANSPQFLLLSLVSGMALACGSIFGVFYHGLSSSAKTTSTETDVSINLHSAQPFISIGDISIGDSET